MNDKEEQANGLDWHLPIPKHHMYAICFFVTVALFTAILLPSPEDLTDNNNRNQMTTGRIPDIVLMQNDVIIADDPNATESIDAETIPEKELTNPDEIDTSGDDAEAADEAEWYVQKISAGDTTADIFNAQNLSYDALKAIMAVPKYGNYIENLTLGDNMSILIGQKGKVLELVKPISKTEQVHYSIIDPKGDYKFNAKIEPIGAHLNTESETENEATTNQESTTPQVEQPAQTPKITEHDVTITKNKEEERLRLEAERRKKQEEERRLQAQRKALTIIVIKPGETLVSAMQRAGLTKHESHVVAKALKGQYSPKKLQPGDELRVLFANDKPNAPINAIYLKSPKSGRIALFRNSNRNNKFYPDANIKGKVKSKTTFNRYPVAPPVRITSNFNPSRRHPITHKVRPHNGTDFGVKVGTPVMAPADGVVVRATYQQAAGNYIVIQHQNGYSTVYMHLSRILVRVGDKVSARQRIALSGNTGYSTGPHLHYELRINNRPVNAMKVSLPSGSATVIETDPKFKKQITDYKRQLGIK